jgi:copper oxidase (laccase) domain-containing protein
VSAAFLTSPILAGHHGFFTRRGGVSTGHYASLNCSTSGGDDPALVAENRRRVAVALGAAPEALLGLKQVHGAQVITVDRPWPAGEGRPADAMVSRVSGIALGIITADCAPVLFHDRAAGIVGAAHAGWRGAVAGVLEATIEAMIALGAMHESRPRSARASRNRATKWAPICVRRFLPVRRRPKPAFPPACAPCIGSSISRDIA